MLTMLIIDDEYLVRTCLKETIEWDKYGIQIIGEASNGQTGYELTLTYKPDIIITDVRMPFLNGLEFMKKIREQEIYSQIIVLSGFEEFDYVRTAMENGAYAYISKPIDNEQLIETVQKLAVKIKEERSTKQYYDRLKEELSSIRKQFVLDIILGKITDKDKIVEKINFLNIPIDINNNIIIVVKFDTNENIHNLQDTERKTNEIIQRYISQLLLLHSEFIGVVIETSQIDQVIILHINNVNCDIISILKERCVELADRIKSDLGCTVSIGISNICNSIEKIYVAYNEACQATKYELLISSNNVAHFRDNDISAYRREIREAIKYIQENYHKDVNIETVSKILYVSPSYLMALFKNEVGKTFIECLTDYRIQKAKELLINSSYKIYEISEMVGYKDFRYFSQLFKKATSYSPKDYRMLVKR